MFLKDDIDSVEFEIMAYLVKHPMASDSLVGITQWWLQQQAIEKNKILVERALENLVKKGNVIKKNNTRNATYSLYSEAKLNKKN
ncbi:MAG: hypothetical protein KAI17_21455 [Thiotrichaceae bacterium]|nr:hypothetical protein [Thiotrichaceae bacterium]